MRKLLITTAIAIMVMAMPVMAQEITTPEQVIKAETFNAGEEKLQREFHNSEVWRAGTYLEYLDGVVYNLEEVARIKKEVVTNYTELAKVNPMYAQYIPSAVKDYQTALNNVEYYKLYKKATTADFHVRYDF